MLELKQVRKSYKAGDMSVEALRGVDVRFRKHEFVAVLGPSGCGKTTLLNIIGGLDRYDSGDLVINGRSTSEYGDRDWDAYRNHSIGFVFQSYNLIPHQSVLANVELALTLSGVPGQERARRAVAALERVGLADQIKKRPNQMSGGQMQRVAIARALVNDPDILLADEPTGALDSETSVQVMETLKEISADRLIIMVTHNPELAEKYATRIIRMLDGRMISDSDPYDGADEQPVHASRRRRARKPSMSIFTALSLSMNNLLTKKTRTLLTAFAGSIGIIGIALILALSNGIQNYINKVQEDTLSSYPITIASETVDMSAMLGTIADAREKDEEAVADGRIHSSTVMYDLLDSIMSVEAEQNDLESFRSFLQSDEEIARYASAVEYDYGVELNVYSKGEGGVARVNPSAVFERFGAMASYSPYASYQADVWTQMLPGEDGALVSELVAQQYELVAGHWPQSRDEVVLIVDENDRLNDLYLYSLGLKDASELDEMIKRVLEGGLYQTESESWSYDELLALTFKLALPTDFYRLNADTGVWEWAGDDETYMEFLIGSDRTLELHVSGIIRPNADAAAASLSGAIGYTGALTQYVIDGVSASAIVAAQLADETTDVLSGLPFDDGSIEEPTARQKADAALHYVEGLDAAARAGIYAGIVSQPDEELIAAAAAQALAAYPTRGEQEAVVAQAYAASAGADPASVSAYLATMDDAQIASMFSEMMAEQARAKAAQEAADMLAGMTDAQKSDALTALLEGADEALLTGIYDEYSPAVVSDSTFRGNLDAFGVVNVERPSSIRIYAATFSDKDSIAAAITRYNRNATEDEQISYTDYVAIIMSSVSTIIDVISYVLIAFVAISLVVSSIMIGIITYISVLERTKEIGILRAIGASKRDVSRVFTAETLIEGLASGAIGIGLTLLLCIPLNLIIRSLTGISNIGAALPWQAGVALVLISMLLTLVAGAIPSRIAAKKDPVVALRTE